MLGIVALLALQAPAPATGSVELDLRCFILTAQLRSSQDPETRRVGETASYFFFGRVDSRIPDEEMEERLWREAQSIGEAEQAAMLQACADFMQARGNRLVEIGRALEVRESAAGARR